MDPDSGWGHGIIGPDGFLCMDSVIDLISPVIQSLYNRVADVLFNSLSN
ncbi:MAG: hypothetical protein ABGX43_03210 [Nitrospinaceae bacterium]